MRPAAINLAADLDKGIRPLYVLCGDEPLLVDEALELLRDHARRAGCEERELHIAERGFDWDGFAAGLQNLSLFSSRRLVELRLPTGKPGDEGARVLTALAGKPDTGHVVVLVLPALDGQTSRSKWATALMQGARWIPLVPPTRQQLPAWLAHRLRKAGLNAEPAAIELLAWRVEGNLLAARQEIDKLALLVGEGRLTAEAVRDAVADGARFDVFQLTDAALAGDVARAVRVLRGLEREGEPEALVLWCLVREILALGDTVSRIGQGRQLDQALQGSGVWGNRRDLVGAAARRLSQPDAMRLVRAAARTDQLIKGARRGQPWNALLEVSLQLGGAPVASAETA
jgi:DNA polymerase-3 subunit delta